jgi:hypothetical protein
MNGSPQRPPDDEELYLDMLKARAAMEGRLAQRDSDRRVASDAGWRSLLPPASSTSGILI